ncbi:MAG: sodium-dependent transporter [Acidobacteriota bacterium]
MPATETFTSRWGLLVAALGMAVGTGNIWRFPRVAAQNGGGAFLVPWLLFLFLWAIPLLMVESAMGRHAGYGVVGAFGKLIGRRFTWMGCFVGFCTLAIMFYYSVVAGWCVKYLVGALAGGLSGIDGNVYWEGLQSSIWEPVLFHFVAMSLGGYIVYRGVVAGIERASKVLIPALFVLLAAAALRAVTLPGATAGLDYLFNPRWSDLLHYRIWLEALTQSAWSTGAGWGLLLTYAVYMRTQDDIVMNSVTIGLGNNAASLMAAMVVIPTVFALLPAEEATEVLGTGGPAGTGLSFIWIPQLFNRIPGGQLFMVFFFLALVVAALSSLISMIELGTRIFMDAGLSRHRALLFVAAGGFVLGVPSAVNLSFFNNQDAVWGIGLMVSGFLFALAVRRFGPSKFREELIDNADNDIPAGRWFDFAIKYLIPLEFALMIVWWLWQAATSGEAWWNPFGVFTLGTCLFQWGVVLLLFYLANHAIAERTLGPSS